MAGCLLSDGNDPMKRLFHAFIVVGVLAFSSSALEASISPQAMELLPLLAKTIKAQWVNCPQPWILAGKIEQESSWKTRAELKTKREYGFGLGQITIAYNTDGSERFNNFIQALKVTMMENQITWEKRFDPKFQLTYAVLSSRSNYCAVSKFFDDDESKTAGMLVAYNAGLGRIVQRKAEAVRRGVEPPRFWFNGGLEDIHSRAEERALYGKPLYRRINEYPRLIMFVRAPKYRLIIMYELLKDE